MAGFDLTTEGLIRIRDTCSDLLWRKYPKLCPTCALQKITDKPENRLETLLPCECASRKREIEYKNARRIRLSKISSYSTKIGEEKPTSIDEWQTMFGSVFAQSIAGLSFVEMALHFLEELGETSDAMIRMYSYTSDNFAVGEPNWRQANLEAQLADVFSWLFALIEKINRSEQDRGRGEQSVFLSQIIWDHYGSDDLHDFYCATCKHARCSCEIILVPDTRSSEELLAKYK